MRLSAFGGVYIDILRIESSAKLRGENIATEDYVDEAIAAHEAAYHS